MAATVREADPVTDEPRDGPPEVLRTGEVARLLGVARSTVLSWAYRGYLDYAVTPGGQLRFYRDQVKALLVDGQDRPGSEPIDDQ